MYEKVDNFYDLFPLMVYIFVASPPIRQVEIAQTFNQPIIFIIWWVGGDLKIFQSTNGGLVKKNLILIFHL